MGLPPSLEVVWGFVPGGLSAEHCVKSVFYSTGASQTHFVFGEADSYKFFHWTLPCLPSLAAMTSRSLGRQQWYSVPALMRHRAYFSCSALSLPSAAFNSQKMTPRDGTDVETRTRSGNPVPSDRHTPGRGDEGENPHMNKLMHNKMSVMNSTTRTPLRVLPAVQLREQTSGCRCMQTLRA